MNAVLVSRPTQPQEAKHDEASPNLRLRKSHLRLMASQLRDVCYVPLLVPKSDWDRENGSYEDAQERQGRVPRSEAVDVVKDDGVRGEEEVDEAVHAGHEQGRVGYDLQRRSAKGGVAVQREST